jgi:site-specific DNA-methyltransferase (adenine-specific)
MPKIELIQGDCLEKMKDIPDGSIDLVLIDPPYFRIKRHYWDNTWDNEQSFLMWFGVVVSEIKRVMKLNGTLLCFAYPDMAFRIEELLRRNYTILNHLVWEKENEKGFDGWKQKCSKESLRKFYPNSERIIFATNELFGEILKHNRVSMELSTINVAEMVGAYGNVNHGGSVSNWERNLNIPTDEQYAQLKQIFPELPSKTEIIRYFSLNKNVQYTDILHYKTVRPYKGKHPCEKPLDLIAHLISSTCLLNGVVLDCFMGSGTTGVACKNLNRNFIGIELDPEYFKIAEKRINENL